MNSTTEQVKRISADRQRTNLLRVPEQAAIAFFCRYMPPFITPDMLTFVSLVASGVIFYGFWLAKSDPFYFSVSIIGFALQWFGDSLDGRLAYYRNTPRKWYRLCPGYVYGLDFDRANRAPAFTSICPNLTTYWPFFSWLAMPGL